LCADLWYSHSSIRDVTFIKTTCADLWYLHVHGNMPSALWDLLHEGQVERHEKRVAHKPTYYNCQTYLKCGNQVVTLMLWWSELSPCHVVVKHDRVKYGFCRILQGSWYNEGSYCRLVLLWEVQCKFALSTHKTEHMHCIMHTQELFPSIPSCYTITCSTSGDYKLIHNLYVKFVCETWIAAGKI